MYQEFRRHKTKNTQLIAMNFIMIILAENVLYNKFSASIIFLNAMHVKAKYSLLYILRSSTPAQTRRQFTFMRRH